MEYSYPIDIDWSQEEIVDVVQFLNNIEQAYENKIDRGKLVQSYKKFKEVVPSKAEENNIYKAFNKKSGYDGYKVIKEMKENQDKKFISLK